MIIFLPTARCRKSCKQRICKHETEVSLLDVPPVLTFAIRIDNSISISGGYSITSRDDEEGRKINEIESDLNFQNKRWMTNVVAGGITINA